MARMPFTFYLSFSLLFPPFHFFLPRSLSDKALVLNWDCHTPIQQDPSFPFLGSGIFHLWLIFLIFFAGITSCDLKPSFLLKSLLHPFSFHLRQLLCLPVSGCIKFIFSSLLLFCIFATGTFMPFFSSDINLGTFA